MGVSRASLSRERTDYAVTKRTWDLEKAALQDNLAGAIGFIRKNEIGRSHISSSAGNTANTIDKARRAREVVPPPLPVYQTYVHFWFKAPNHVRATTTNTPVPYGIGYGWTEIEHCISSGKYDSREDPLVTTATLPTEFVRYVPFESSPEYPPQVLVWLTGLSAVAGAEVNVTVRAREITEAGFELEIRSHGGVPIGSVDAGWAFFDSQGERDHPTLVVDTYRSEPWRETPMLTKACILARGGIASKVGYAAISSLHLVLEERIWVEMKVNMEMHHPGNMGTTVRIHAGPVESKVYSVGMECYTVENDAGDGL